MRVWSPIPFCLCLWGCAGPVGPTPTDEGLPTADTDDTDDIGDTADTGVEDTAPEVPLTECEKLAKKKPSIEVGSGETTFLPVVEDQYIDVVYGPQGGWHVLGSVRTTGIKAGPPDVIIDPSTPILTFELATSDDVVFGGYQQLPRPMSEVGFGELQIVGEFLVLWVAAPEPYYDQPVTLRATLADACGSVVADEATVRLRAETLP